MDISTLRNLHQMSKDPISRLVLTNDETCIGGLVLLLSDDNDSTIILILNIFSEIETSIEGHEKLKTFIGVKEQLLNLMERKESVKEIMDLSLSLFQKLYHPDQKQVQKDGGSTFGKKSKSIVYVFQLHGVREREDCEIVEKEIIAIKGIVSITFCLKKRRVIIRAKPNVRPHIISDVISSTGITVDQVLKDQRGKEILKPMLKVADVNAVTPDYLPDDKDIFCIPKNDAPTIPNASSNNGQSWWNKASKFFENSFFW